MSKAGSSPFPTHLLAALVAVLGMAAVVAAVPQLMAAFGKQGLNALLTEPAMQKDMGTLLQSMGISDPAMLPVFGSSELTWRIDNRADRFFASAPTGFQICPVGGPGNTTLMMAEKIAAQGALMKDRKLVILLSCSWFRRAALPAPDYAGNFSPSQATNILLGGSLDNDVRRRLAARMLDYPDTLKESPSLSATSRALVAATPLSTWLAWSQSPLLRLQQAAMAIEDNLGTALSLMIQKDKDKKKDADKDTDTDPAKPKDNYSPDTPIRVAVTQPFSWDKVIARAHEFAPEVKPMPQTRKPGAADDGFIAGFANAREWDDFELLLDTCKSLQAEPLVIAIPLDGAYENSHGVSSRGRDYYYNRLGDACNARGFRLMHFNDHDLDTEFVINHSSHLSGKGWIFIDRLLDDFYHNRLPPPAASVTHS